MKPRIYRRRNRRPNLSSSENFFQKEGNSILETSDTTPFFDVKPQVQTKLSVSQPNEPAEVQADAMADNVVNKITNPSIHRKCAACEQEDTKVSRSIFRMEEEEAVQAKLFRQEEEEEPIQAKLFRMEEEEESLQAKSNGKIAIAPNSVAQQIKQSKGSGNQMADPVKNNMESAFGTNFKNVRIHTNEKAQAMSSKINAQAFTFGNDIYFNKNKYNPNSKSGQHLLAHELTHVVQQNNKSINRKPKPPSPTQIAIDAQKTMWLDLKTHFPGDGRKLAGSGYEAGANFLRLDLTDNRPILNVGKSYAEESDVKIRKEKLKIAIKALDNFRVDNGLIDDLDISNATVNQSIDQLNVIEKQSLINKITSQKFIKDNLKMAEHIRKKMPSTSYTKDATTTADGGFEYQFDNIKIIVKQDVFNSAKVSSGAETELTPVLNPSINYPAYRYDGKGKITSITPTPTKLQFSFKIQTHYSSEANPTDTSGYGVGTEAGAKGKDTHLRKHEAAHGEVFIQHIQNNHSTFAYPTFKGAIGQERSVFENHLQTFKTKTAAFLQMIKTALSKSEQNVDCTGQTTIEDFHKGKGTTSPVVCKTP